MYNHHRPRTVITGLGAISPLGLTTAEFWSGLLAGRSGISRVTQFDCSALPCQIAGEVKEFDPRRYMDFKEARRMSRCSQFAIATAREAVADAGFSPSGFEAAGTAAESVDPERVAVVLGTAIGGLEKADEGISTLREGGYN